MKFLFLVLFSSFSFADNHEAEKEKMFQENKSIMQTHLDERIGQLNKAKACISSATKHEEMKKCREEMKAGMKEIHSEFKEERSERRERRDELRKKKLEEKIKKIDENKKLKLKPE